MRLEIFRHRQVAVFAFNIMHMSRQSVSIITAVSGTDLRLTVLIYAHFCCKTTAVSRKFGVTEKVAEFEKRLAELKKESLEYLSGALEN